MENRKIIKLTRLLSDAYFKNLFSKQKVHPFTQIILTVSSFTRINFQDISLKSVALFFDKIRNGSGIETVLFKCIPPKSSDFHFMDHCTFKLLKELFLSGIPIHWMDSGSLWRRNGNKTNLDALSKYYFNKGAVGVNILKNKILIFVYLYVFAKLSQKCVNILYFILLNFIPY